MYYRLVDTSQGIPKTLKAEIVLPLGLNKLLQSIAAPPINRDVVDTSKGVPRQLAVELVPPGGVNKLVQETKCPEVVRVYLLSYLNVLAINQVPVPFLNIPQPLVRYVHNLADTSKGTPRQLAVELVPPSGTNQVIQGNKTPEIPRVYGLSYLNTVILSQLPVPFFILSQPFVRFVHNVMDTSKGMAKVLYGDASTPVQNRPGILVEAPRQIYGIQYGNLQILTPVVVTTPLSYSGMLAARHVRRRIHGIRR
jgi:hypothetical protein